MATLTLIVTDYASNQELLRLSYPFRGDLADEDARVRAAVRRVREERGTIAAMFTKPLEFDRRDTFEWVATAADLSSIPPLAWVCVEFYGDHAPVPLPIEEQYQELANAIAQQAEALALGRIPDGQRYAQVRRLAANIETLAAWTPDDRKVRP